MSAGAFVECSNCYGTGKIVIEYRDRIKEETCPYCKGKGGEEFK